MKTESQNSRRSFLKKAGWSALGMSSLPLISTTLASCENKPKSTVPPMTNPGARSVVTRKNIADIPVNDPEMQVFRDAVRILKERSEKSPLDPAGWQAHGALHTTFCASSIYANQVHYNWYVWPWHRLYLWSMEQKLQKAVGEPQLALHYWDWTKSNFIPEHYWGDNSNPLFNPNREVAATDEIPKDFINVGAAFRASRYKTFGGYPAIKEPNEPQLDGIAEHSFHNNIHNWIGGQMATFTESGYEPIFYGHHGNCDRIWEAWQNYSPENTNPDAEEWLEKKLYATDGNGRPVEFKIKELLDTEALGYRFNDLDLNPTFCNPYEEDMKPARQVSKVDCVEPLNLETSDKDSIYRELSNKERAHVMLHFERAQLPYQPYCARVFFEYEKNGARKSSYSGTFTILPILGMDTFFLQNGVHLQIEIEKDVVDAIKADKNIEVVFQPVPLPNRNIPDDILKLENISLVTDYETS